MMGLLVHLPFYLLALAMKVALAGPPCSGDRSIAVCAEFITPYFYQETQWRVDCGMNAAPQVLIAYNIPGSYNASTPDCGYPGYYTAACCASWSLCEGLAIDCDTQTSRPIPYGDSVMPDGWSIYSTPCAVDSPPGSVFVDGAMTLTAALLPYYCALSCDSAGYIFAGVEMGDQCWCANGLAASIVSAPLTTECDWPCQGGYGYSCGAYERVQIFSKS